MSPYKKKARPVESDIRFIIGVVWERRLSRDKGVAGIGAVAAVASDWASSRAIGQRTDVAPDTALWAFFSWTALIIVVVLVAAGVIVSAVVNRRGR